MEQTSQTSSSTGHVNPSILNEFFTEDALARELSTSRKTLARWEKAGRGPRRTKIGKRIFYSHRAVREWLQSCEASNRNDRQQRGRLRGSRRGSAA
jgi:predicted DNA-binding transcriptional regulator AlpA